MKNLKIKTKAQLRSTTQKIRISYPQFACLAKTTEFYAHVKQFHQLSMILIAGFLNLRQLDVAINEIKKIIIIMNYRAGLDTPVGDNQIFNFG